MRFLLVIYGDERRLATRDEGTAKAEIDAYWALDNEATEKGVFVDSAGPFAETKEQLGGFYLLECDGVDEALEWAAKVPAAQTGSVEVRQVMDYEAAGYPNPAGEAARSA